jgi:hypothetical protein
MEAASEAVGVVGEGVLVAPPRRLTRKSLARFLRRRSAIGFHLKEVQVVEPVVERRSEVEWSAGVRRERS